MEHVTCLDIPSKGTLYRYILHMQWLIFEVPFRLFNVDSSLCSRPWDTKYKRDSTWMASNGTYWGSDVIISGIHFQMEEVESQARRDAWTKNTKDIKEFVLAYNRSVVPGHLDDRHKWTTKDMLDYPIKYIATYEEALKMNMSDEFWDRVMNDNADDALLFLLDWSSDRFYTSQRKTPIP